MLFHAELMVLRGKKLFYLQDDETEALLAADFEIGHFFRERLIPKVSNSYSVQTLPVMPFSKRK